MLPPPRPSDCAQGQHPDLGENVRWVQIVEKKLSGTTREMSLPSCKIYDLEDVLICGVCLHLLQTCLCHIQVLTHKLYIFA